VRARLADDRLGELTDTVYVIPIYRQPITTPANAVVTMVTGAGPLVQPDSVQDFTVRLVDPTTVVLQWKPPRKPGVVRYRVNVRIYYRHFVENYQPALFANC
jgi:hypothetical protein